MSAKTNKINFFKQVLLFFILITINQLSAQKIGDIFSIQDFQKQNYKLFFQKDYSFNSKKIYLYIIEKNDKRTLILCEKKLNNEKKIIAINKDIIYPDSSDCTKGGFKKIAQKGGYFTIEENFCSIKREQYLKEYFTFKYNENNCNFFLYKYSFNLVNSLPADDNLPPRNYIEDEYPIEIFTEKDFGKIEINSFNKTSIKNIRDKYLEDK